MNALDCSAETSAFGLREPIVLVVVTVVVVRMVAVVDVGPAACRVLAHPLARSAIEAKTSAQARVVLIGSMML